MGFGSYDESEQQNQAVTTDEDEVEGVNVHQNDHDGKLTFETEASTGELIDKLGEMKSEESD